MSKHAQGPWWRAKDSDGTWQIGAADQVIAVAKMDSLVYGLKAGGDNEANARLIAAAPELLEALRGLVSAENAVTTGQQRERLKEWIPLARAAIAKAEGVDP